ncbi:hypothetical protein PEL8287_01400 [Roseovarius litorisediminis]|uniref:Uncharacterized protein n=1 Tax=Roseovarius litorisediminis TaxID=1312363 RepID=A0A1Y5S100_9RHOB|nr:hypothetical protein [Roseovarius litorisediminis]SLN30182.1 hypothetical protein PEL8287_01400 [Roseovarius litorisediminis]
MNISRILRDLEDVDASGPAAQAAARLGFLEWAFSSAEATPQAACRALEDPATQKAQSAAAQAFVSYLHEATLTIAPRRRKSRLH